MIKFFLGLFFIRESKFNFLGITEICYKFNFTR